MASLISWTVAFVFLVFILHKLINFLKKRAIINKIPGPKGIPILGNSLELFTNRDNLLETMNHLSQPFTENFPLLKVWLGPFPVIVVMKAEAAKVILNSNHHLEKATYYDFLRNWIGDGLLTSHGSKWQHRRKLLTPSFHFRILESFLLVMNEQADILLDLLEKKNKKNDDQSFDIYPFITRCTLDIICETAMGQGVSAQVNTDSEYVNSINHIGQAIFLRMLRPWLTPQWLYRWTSLGRMEKKALNVVHGFTEKIIKMKRENLKNEAKIKVEEKNGDAFGLKRRVALLDLLLENSEENFADHLKLTDKDIREEVDTFMFEGHDTTSVGITWALLAIGQLPDVQKKIFEELDGVFGNSTANPTSTDLNNLKYLECVIKEALRLFSPVPIYGRTLREEVDVCGYKIPRGVDIVVIPLLVHRDPKHYVNPQAFDPDRFLPENIKDKNPFAYIPFSAGPRNCIGQKFALMEEKVILSKILRKFKITSLINFNTDGLFTNEKLVESKMACLELVMRPIKGVEIKLEAR